MDETGPEPRFTSFEDPLRALEQEHLGDAAAERVTHDIDVLQSERREPSSDDVRVPREGVARVGPSRQVVTGKVRNENAAVARPGLRRRVST